MNMAGKSSKAGGVVQCKAHVLLFCGESVIDWIKPGWKCVVFYYKKHVMGM